MRNRLQKKAMELKKMIRQRQKKLAIRAGTVLGNGQQDQINFLIECLGTIHHLVFGSELKTVTDQGFMKYALEAEDFICFIAFDPPADCIPGFTLPVNHSMFFAGLLSGAPSFNGKKMRGIYAINTDALMNKWLNHVKTSFPGISDKDREAVESTNIIQLVAHEIRHEVQYFTKPKRHNVHEIRELCPNVFAGWQNRTLSIFKKHFSKDMIDRDEDAIVVELFVQQLCMNSPKPDEAFFPKIARLVKE